MPVAMNCVGKAPEVIVTLLETGTMGVAPAMDTAAPVGTATLIPPWPMTGWTRRQNDVIMVNDVVIMPRSSS